MNLPTLCTPKDVGARILQQQRTEAAKAAAENVAMEMESDSEDENEAEPQNNGSVEDAQKRQQNEDEASSEQQAHQNKKHAAYEVTQPAPAAPSAGNVVIRDYDPKKCTQF